MLDEARRLREILATLARGGLGEGALVEFMPPDGDGTSYIVVCCGSRDEAVLLDVVRAAVTRVLGGVTGEATMRGTVAADDVPESGDGG